MQARFLLRPGAYYDSLVLMRLQQALASLPGVSEAGVVMGTAANCEMLARSGLLAPPLQGIRSDDLVIAVRAQSAEAAEAALAKVDDLLVRPGETEQEYSPRSLQMAARLLPQAGWVLVSVPGDYAAGVARQALGLGKHVFLFSDHVPLAEEAELKREASARGLLVLGPECGTAIVGGIGLGFANRVRRGSVGLVAASGTGLQQVSCTVSRRSGVSHALGTGGRDLTDEVGGGATLQALDLLRRDPETQVIVLISKSPSGRVIGPVLEAARRAEKPVVVAFLGYAAPARRAGALMFALSLEDAASLAVSLAAEVRGRDMRDSPAGSEPAEHSFMRGQRYVRGLYSGGSLAAEARQLLRGYGLDVASNLPGDPVSGTVPEGYTSGVGHSVLDLGAEEYTQGRPHPMISQTLRANLLLQQARDPEVAVILLDVVLGDGAHPDPARELAPACALASEEARRLGRHVEVIAVVVGTEEDPQGLESQARQLEAAGVHVVFGNEAAVSRAASLVRALDTSLPPKRPVSVPLTALEPPAAVLNVGLQWFTASLGAQGVQALHVDWRPPAGGDDRLRRILERMERSRR